MKAAWISKSVSAVLPPDAADAALECADADVPQHLAADDEETARLMQDVLKADAAAGSYLAARSAALKEARAEADRALACMQEQKARAQALVRGTPLWRHGDMLFPRWRPACTNACGCCLHHQSSIYQQVIDVVMALQEARATAALAEAQARQQREADERLAAERAQKKKAKKARRRQAEATGQWPHPEPPLLQVESLQTLQTLHACACKMALPLLVGLPVCFLIT